jgi:hypothetical protein
MVEGETVTPVGSPFTATATVPAKPAIAVLFSVTGALAPGVRVSVLGAAVSVKSFGLAGPLAVTERATDVFALRLPDTPFTVTVLEPTAAVDAALSVKLVLLPALMVAVAGETVTPDGRPLTETATEPLKLLELLGVTVNVWLCPCATVTEGFAVSVKLPLSVEPQPANKAVRGRVNRQARTNFA